MKSYTITCHNVYNYGASLQAYALQKYLLSLGIENKIIDYAPDYLNWHYHLTWWISPRSKYYSKLKTNPLLRLIYVVKRYLTDLKSYKRKKAFDSFSEHYLLLTKCCTNFKDVEFYSQDAELLITGSDQVWSSIFLENGLDPVFYVNFGPPKCRRISYAASFGGEKINDSYSESIKKWLENIDSISVREKTGLQIIEKLGLKGENVCDPVFLLPNEDWQQLGACTDNRKDYILVYNLGKVNSTILQHAYYLKKLTGFKIISILAQNRMSVDEEISNADPSMFVSLIKNADFILTNSFHATSFSLIFNKNFYCYTEDNKHGSRLVDLVSFCGLLERINPMEIDVSCISFNKVNSLLSSLRGQSQQWLKNQIEITQKTLHGTNNIRHY